MIISNDEKNIMRSNINLIVYVVITIVFSCKTKENINYSLINDLLEQEKKEITSVYYDTKEQAYINERALISLYFIDSLSSYNDGLRSEINKIFPEDTTNLIYSKLKENNKKIDTTYLKGFIISINPNKEIREYKKIITFSIPIILKNKALVEIEYHYLGSSKGITYILEKKNNKWFRIEKLVRWIE